MMTFTIYDKLKTKIYRQAFYNLQTKQPRSQEAKQEVRSLPRSLCGPLFPVPNPTEWLLPAEGAGAAISPLIK